MVLQFGPKQAKVYNELVNFFMDQFIFNAMINVSLRDLDYQARG